MHQKNLTIGYCSVLLHILLVLHGFVVVYSVGAVASVVVRFVDMHGVAVRTGAGSTWCTGASTGTVRIRVGTIVSAETKCNVAINDAMRSR